MRKRRTWRKLEMKAKKLLMMAMLPVLLLLLPGCGENEIILYPIDKSDIFRMESGKSYTPEKDGFFLSGFYIKEVMDAKVNE